ncbi:MAG TPA: hypothetical protein VGC39_03370 [Candidatus Methylacidiphilales bacterium]
MPSDPQDLQSPKEFLRQRRPERFSDSKTAEIRGIDRSTLEQQLDTLTNRNQESDFQNFALKLAEKVVCPNLRPQTGPTGGGDSKADAETYPVADDLAYAWFTGNGRDSSLERWAFAFSAMKKWQGKVKSDIAKIAKTERGYAQAFFITNQYVPDKKRAEIEDELAKEHKLKQVTILDRSWILNEVFKGGYEELAIEQLHLSTPAVPKKEPGPLDVQRKKALEEAEEQITALLAGRSADSRLVWYSIEAGRLARELEMPRPQVDGRYQRAIDLADKYGTDRQKTEARYQFGWSTFWWQEDFCKFVDLYLEFEGLTKDSSDIGELRELHNLWNLLSRVKASGQVPGDKLRWNGRIMALSNALERMTKAEEMPSAVLEARAMLLFMQAAVTYPNVPPSLFTQFKDVVIQSERFIGFPLESTVELIGYFGELFPDSKEYDDLNETIATVLAKNDGETASAEKLLQRSIQKLDGGHNYDAIELAGRALSLLWKNETQAELIQALYVSAIAYERIGLFWAARGSLVNAASLMINNFRRHNDPHELRASCFERLKWIELFLGRLPDAFAWFDLEQVTRIAQKEKVEPKHAEDFILFGSVLGVYFLRADLPTLKKLERLPDVLDAKGLYHTRAALLFALGWEDKAKEEIGEGFGDNSAEVFIKWRDADAVDDLPEKMRLGDEAILNLKSTVLGCDVRLTAQGGLASRLVSETFLSALEGALATAYREQLIPMGRAIEVSISTVEEAAFPFTFKVEEAGTKLKCTIECPSFNPNKVRHEDQSKIKDKLHELLVEITTHFFPISDFLERLKRVFFENDGFRRAVNFTGSIVTLGNVLGNKPPTNIGDWIAEAKHTYELKRTKPWDEDSGVTRRQRAIAGSRGPAEPGADPRHQDISSMSIINARLWDKAEWGGTVYIWANRGLMPPLMGLGFQDVEAAEVIFKGFREEFGEIDEGDDIRITIIKGVYKDYPRDYRIALCGNVEGARNRVKTHFANVTRMHTMKTSDGANLRHFLDNFERAGIFYITFAKLGDMTTPPRVEFKIGKRHLVVKDAWTIGLNDIDSAAIQTDDDPVIPSGTESAPVVALLAKKREQPAGS